VAGPNRNLGLTIVSLGGNAIIRRGQRGAIEEQFDNADRASSVIAGLAARGVPLVITHGNGPVVGNIVIRNEAAKDVIPPMPLYIAGADSQGGIGFMLQQTLLNRLMKERSKKDVATLITQVVVDTSDPAFKDPTKPIGPYYTPLEAETLSKERGWIMKEDSHRGYRRVVPSPRPVRIIGSTVIKRLTEDGVIVIAAGGGGVPVVDVGNGIVRGVDAVIDKDLTTALLGKDIGAVTFIDLTQVDNVYLDYGEPGQRAVSEMSVVEAQRYLEEGQFAPGSMRPKIEAAIGFLRSGGREVIITSPELAEEALEGRAGTRIVP